MRTLTLSLPLLNPIASCDSRQDEDGVNCDLTRPLNHKSKSARKREKQQAKKQADQQRSESAPDLRFVDGLEEDFVLAGALLVVDAFATYDGGFGCLCALKSWWSTLPSTAAGTRGGLLAVPASSRRSTS